MQTELETGALLRELRPSRSLYGTYGAITVAGLATAAWLRFGSGRWVWLVEATGLWWPLLAGAVALVVWGTGGAVTLARWRLRFYERGVYQGPSSGHGGVFLPYSSVVALQLDVVHFPAPLRPLIGHYRVVGHEDEIVLFPKLYRDIEEIAAELERRTSLTWTEIRLSRQEPGHPDPHPG
jgi:hypothetical protein